MNNQAPGATPEEWARFRALGLADDLLPVVSNPDARISPSSKMKDLGKTPSQYTKDGLVVGIPQWTAYLPNDAELAAWQTQPDYGICLQTRRVRAFDIDIPDPVRAAAVVSMIESLLGRRLPKRFRADSGKCLLMFVTQCELARRSFHVDGGIIELLAKGQQFVAAGRHPDGARYAWTGLGETLEGLLLTAEEVELVWDTAELTFCTGVSHRGRLREPVEGSVRNTSPVDDAVATWLELKGLVRGSGAGKLYLACPWKDTHGKQGDMTQTVWLRGGTNGFQVGRFQCLDAACEGHGNKAFLDAVGFTLDGFVDESNWLPPPPLTNPCREVDLGPEYTDVTPEGLPGEPTPATVLEAFGAGPVVDGELIPKKKVPVLDRIQPQQGGLPVAKPTSKNLGEILAFPEHLNGVRFQYNQFLDQVEWCEPGKAPTPLTDFHLILVRHRLDTHGKYPFMQLSLTMLDEAIHLEARRHTYDPILQWLGKICWDGVPRVASFYARYLGAPASAMASAYSRYLWTALVGRATTPGIQADMMPIWASPQGSGKSRSAEAMVPNPSMFTAFHLGHRDRDVAMLFQGRLLLEASELRGLQTKEAGEIKDLLSTSVDTYRKPYGKKVETHARRCLFIGTTNEDRFLADSTGSRRFLPMTIGRKQDVEGIVRDREQLWAEAYVLFKTGGIAWAEASHHAAQCNEQFETLDTWTELLDAWIGDADGYTHPLTTSYLLEKALGVTTDKQHQGLSRRLSVIMKRDLGFVQIVAKVPGSLKCIRKWVKNAEFVARHPALTAGVQPGVTI